MVISKTKKWSGRLKINKPKTMITLSRYYYNFKDAHELVAALRKPRFLKTEMDLSEGDFYHFKQNDLLWKSDDGGLGPINYSYIDYTWAKLVNHLLHFGFSFDAIKIFKHNLSKKVDNDLFKKAVKEKREVLLKYISNAELNEFYSSLEQDDSHIIYLSLFESLLLNAISHNDNVSILFFRSEPYFCIPISREILMACEQSSDSERYYEYLNKTHVSITINDIIASFINNDLSNIDVSSNVRSIVSEREHNLLKIIRTNYTGLKSILVKTQDDKFQMIETTTTKKTKAESMVIQHFKKGDYKSIRIEAVDGKTAYIEEIKKYKL